MNHLISFLGIIIVLLGTWMLIRPATLFGLFRAHAQSPGLHLLAVAVRLILGLALLAHAAESRYPVALQVLGWLTVLAAVVLAAMGRSRFTALMKWVLALEERPWLPRASGLLALLLGAFLVHAVN